MIGHLEEGKHPLSHARIPSQPCDHSQETEAYDEDNPMQIADNERHWTSLHQQRPEDRPPGQVISSDQRETCNCSLSTSKRAVLSVNSQSIRHQ